MKKKYPVTVQDKKDWAAFTKDPSYLYDKEDNSQNENNKKDKIIKLDLHGFSLDEANQKVKKFIIKAYNSGYKKLIIVTGKGLRSKTYNNPYASNQMSILKNSIPEYISNDVDLSNIIKTISKADMQHGGEGAICISLKELKKL